MTQGKVTSVGPIRKTVPSELENTCLLLPSSKVLSIHVVPTQPKAQLKGDPQCFYARKLILLKASIKATLGAKEQASELSLSDSAPPSSLPLSTSQECEEELSQVKSVLEFHETKN